MGALEIFTSVCILIFLLYKYGTRKFGYWKSKGIKEMNPYPFFGDNHSIIKWNDPIKELTRYQQYFKGERFGGVYFFQEPFLIIQDLELLKLVLIKDAEYFVNRFGFFENSDPIMSRNLFTLKDEKWKNLRTVMTTVFTSAKMKDMFKFMEKCADQAVEYIDNTISEQIKSKHTDGEIYKGDIKDFFSRYGTDVIATTAFGLEVDSFKNPNNEFYSSGFVIRNFGKGLSFFKMLIFMMLPKLASALKLTFFGNKMNNFFISIVSDTIKNREKRNIVRKDVIHILTEARKGKGVNENGDFTKGKLPDLTDLDIASQAVLFFFGGFETMATLMAFACYELAINPDIQKKLHEELDNIYEKENGITYEGVMHQSQYLDMVVSETLRKWPPAPIMDREVTKTYVIPKTENSPELVLERGDKIMIPILGMQRDPNLFPDPEKFDPERFRDEKNTIKPMSYLPFGAGIRHCIGMRFALMEAKTCLFHLLKKYEVVTTDKTQIPIKLERNGSLVLRPEKGYHLGLKRRS